MHPRILHAAASPLVVDSIDQRCALHTTIEWASLLNDVQRTNMKMKRGASAREASCNHQEIRLGAALELEDIERGLAAARSKEVAAPHLTGGSSGYRRRRALPWDRVGGGDGEGRVPPGEGEWEHEPSPPAWGGIQKKMTRDALQAAV